IVWAMGHISQGMYTGTHERKTYGNVAAIQIGYLLEHGALTRNPDGTLAIHADKLVPAIDEMMKTVAGIKARGDKAAAEAPSARGADASRAPTSIASPTTRATATAGSCSTCASSRSATSPRATSTRSRRSSTIRTRAPRAARR